jgi:C1A family cysteine protease
MALGHLQRGLPLMLGLELYTNFYMLDNSNPLLDRPSGSDKFRGLHAIALVGRLAGSHPWVLRNSWGTSWGDGGYAYASDDALAVTVRETLGCEA